jgi:hypothetical protein
VGRVHPSGSPWSRSHSVGVRRRTDDEPIGLSVVVVRATAAKAAESGRGSCRPRVSARRKIPAAALRLKEYLGGTSASSTSAKEVNAPPPLGHAEVAAVQDSPGEVVNPDVGQRRENEGEIAAAVRGKQSGYVLKEHPAPSGEKSGSDAGELKEEPRTLPVESRTSSSDGDILAGEAADEQITCGMA